MDNNGKTKRRTPEELVIGDVLARGGRYPFFLPVYPLRFSDSSISQRFFAHKSGYSLAKVVPFLTEENVRDIFLFHATDDQKKSLGAPVFCARASGRVDVTIETGRHVAEVYIERLEEFLQIQRCFDESVALNLEKARSDADVPTEFSHFALAVGNTFRKSAALVKAPRGVGGILPDELRIELERIEFDRRRGDGPKDAGDGVP